MIIRRRPSRAAWFASAALLISGTCALAQAPIIDASSSYGGRSAPTPASAAAQPAAPAQAASGNLMLQIQALQQEVMELRGIVEEQSHQIETLKQQSLDRYLELDRRISGGAAAGFSTGAATGAAAGGVSGARTTPAIDATAPLQPPSGSVQPIDALPANGVADVGVSGATVSGATVSGATVAPTGAVAGSVAPQADEYEAYKQAYAKVKEQNFAAAIQSFNAFIKSYPSSTLTPNAYYWLGELYLQTPQDLDAADKAFSHVVKHYPQHSKAPDSLYKLGRVYYMKGDKQRARDMLQQVIDEYGASGSVAPQLAKQFLDQNYR